MSFSGRVPEKTGIEITVKNIARAHLLSLKNLDLQLLEAALEKLYAAYELKMHEEEYD